MALTKAATTLASGVTTTSTTPAQDCSNAYAADVGVKIVQVGSATSAASFKVEVSFDGGTDYYTHAEASAGLAAATYTWTIALPPSATHVRIAFVTQSGGSSSTLDAELGEVTAV